MEDGVIVCRTLRWDRWRRIPERIVWRRDRIAMLEALQGGGAECKWKSFADWKGLRF